MIYTTSGKVIEVMHTDKGVTLIELTQTGKLIWIQFALDNENKQALIKALQEK